MSENAVAGPVDRPNTASISLWLGCTVNDSVSYAVASGNGTLRKPSPARTVKHEPLVSGVIDTSQTSSGPAAESTLAATWFSRVTLACSVRNAYAVAISV